MAYVNEKDEYINQLISEMSTIAGLVREGDEYCSNACLNPDVVSGDIVTSMGRILTRTPIPDTIDKMKSYISNYLQEIQRVDQEVFTEIDQILAKADVTETFESVDLVLYNEKLEKYRKTMEALGLWNGFTEKFYNNGKYYIEQKNRELSNVKSFSELPSGLAYKDHDYSNYKVVKCFRGVVSQTKDGKCNNENPSTDLAKGFSPNC